MIQLSRNESCHLFALKVYAEEKYKMILKNIS